jgi:alpha-tubulin suppressor-like RCC1 family protein
MYYGFIYPFDGGNVTVTLTNIPAGAYDLYLYSHNGNFQVTSGATTSPIQTCYDVPTTNPQIWQEGKQYVLFRDVQVAGNQPIVITVRPTSTDVAIIAGLQLAAVVPTPPSVVVQPTNQIVGVGTNASFAVSADGTAPLAYQWFFDDAPLADGGNVSGANSNILSIVNARTNDAGNYFVVITNSVGAVTSVVARLDMGFPPIITSSPTSQTNLTGSTVAFTVVAEGTAPLNYQWRFNGTDLSDNARIIGATNSTLTISNLMTGDAGNYEVIVMNPVGSVTSVVATLTILQPPTFTAQPVGRSVVPTLPTTFNALATSSYPIGYQWQLNGTNISGATNTNYEIPAVGTNDFGFYQLVASNELGVATSASAELTFGTVVAWGRNLSGECLPPPGLSNVFAVAGSFGSSVAVRTDGSLVTWGGGSQSSPPDEATNVVSVSSCGGTVVLRADGKIVGWKFGSTSLIQVPSFTNIIAVAAGFSHGLALRFDGQVLSWGNSPASAVPAGLGEVSKIACGVNHSLALRSDGTVVAWGNIGSATNVPSGLKDVVAIAGGVSHSLALKSDGTVVAWGTGSGTNLPKGLTNIVAISSGGYPQGQGVNLAIRSNGTVVAWGDNGFGETNTPPALSNMVSVAIAGAPYHSLAIVSDGKPLIVEQPVGGTSWTGREFKMSASAVGFTNSAAGGIYPLQFQWQFNGVDIAGATNSSITLANLTTNNAGSYQLIVSNVFGVAVSIAAPLKVLSNVPPTLLSQPPSIQTNYLGNVASLGVTVAGSGPITYQWRAAIGGPSTNIPGATNAALVFDPVLMSHPGGYFVQVTSPFGSVSTRGTTLRVQPVRVWGYSPIEPPSTLTNVISVAAGFNHYLALRPDGRIVGWGSGFYGETNPPASLSNSIVTAISAGYQHSLALRSDGIPVAWGFPSFGLTNVPVSGNNIIAISAGRDYDLALRADGTVVAWGNNYPYGQTNVPVSATNVIAISAGGYHGLALRSNGTIVSWGYNGYGQTSIPLNATNIIAIAAGGNHSLALRADGTVLAWGYNVFGQTNGPAGLSNVVAISASGGHNTALRSDGSVVTWGNYLFYNTSGNVTPQGDFASAIQIADGGDRSICLFGTRVPAITIQPFSRTVFKGSNTVLIAKASAAQPANYQWVFNGANISGATNDSLILTNLQFAQSGAYQLVVSNRYGITASKPAKVVVSIPLGLAVDFEKGVTWTSTGVSAWFGQTNTTHDHIDAARSGDIDHGQETILQTILQTSPTQISFWWKVSSETGFDKLEFLVNGVVQATISGEVDWQQRIVPLPVGSPLLQWRYSKDGSGSIGQDAGWVDQISLVPNPPVITVQPISKTVEMGTNVTFSVGVSGTGPLGFQWRKNETNLFGGGSLLTLNNVGRAQRGVYSVIVTNAGGSATSSNVILKVLVPQQLSAPTLLPDGTFQFSSTDADGGLLSTEDLVNLELQASDDLTNWVALPNGLSLTNGTLLLKDTEQTNFPARFYRIVEH